MNKIRMKYKWNCGWLIDIFIILSIEKIINYAFNMFKQITPTLNMFLADLIFN